MATTTDTTPLSLADHGPFAAARDELKSLQRVVQALSQSESGPLKLVPAGGEEITLSPTLLRILRLVTATLAADRAVVVASLGKVITPHEAADLLGFSVHYLMTVVDAGELPATQDNGIMLLALDDVLAYREEFRRQRRAALRELAQLGQSMGHGDPDLETIELKRLAEFEDEAKSSESRP